MIETHRTACSRDCPDACSLDVHVEDGRVVALHGAKSDPVTQGFICERTRRFLYRQYHPDRFLEPMILRDGRRIGVSWEEALDHVAKILREAVAKDGPESIFHYRSGGSLGILKFVSEVFFRDLGPVTVKRGDICSGAGEAAQEMDFGISESHDLFDLLNSRCIVLWGKNPHTSGVHLIPVLKNAKKRGARLVTIDPVRTKAAGLSDLYLQPRPGTDAALAFGVARILMDDGAWDPSARSYCEGWEEYRSLVASREAGEWAAAAGVPLEGVEALARLYGDGPSALLVGWGLGRRRNGCAAVRALDALAAVTGNLGVPGGGVSFYFGRRTAFDVSFGAPAVDPPRTISEPLLGRELLALEDPVRVMWVTAGNPVSMLPESETVRRALRGLKELIVVDTHPNDTTDLATVILPTLTLLEDDDVLGAYGNHWLRVSRPAVAPPPGCRHELWIFQELSRRLGLPSLTEGDARAWKRRAMSRLEKAGVTLEDLEEGPKRNPFAAEVLFADRRFPTPSGKVNLLRDDPAPSFTPTKEWPFALMAASVPKCQSSQWSVPVPDEPAEARVHPHATSLAEGSHAVLETAHGVLEVIVRHDPRVHPSMIVTGKGGMVRDRRCANAVVAAALTDGGEGAAYYDEPCRLRAL